MHKHQSLIVAEMILANLEYKTEPEYTRSWTVEVMANGREQCLVIWNYEKGKKVAFGEHRNSDNIIVYYGESLDFDISTNQPDDWSKKKYFHYGNTEEACEFILEWLEYAQ